MIQNYIEKLFTDFEKIRKQKGDTQRELAEKFNITRSHLNKVINLRTDPSVDLIKKIEEYTYGKEN